MDATLKTWKLTPSTSASALWSLSTFTTVAYVRAQGPFEARLLAAERFRKFDALTSNGKEPRSPCLDPDLVYCIEVTDERLRVLQSPCVLTEAECYAILPGGLEPQPKPEPSLATLPTPTLSPTPPPPQFLPSGWSALRGIE